MIFFTVLSDDNIAPLIYSLSVMFCVLIMNEYYLKFLTWILLMNKVCASGMKAVMLAAQQVQLGHPGVLVAVRIRGH